MKVAVLVNNNGEKIKIHAKDDNCRIYLKELICPNCGEKVNWINGKIQERHFRHQHGSYSEYCENYCSSISDEKGIIEPETRGHCMYLIKEFNTYRLAIGLNGLDESVIQDAEKLNLELEIKINKNEVISKMINFENFIPNQITFIKLEDVKPQYRIDFSGKIIPKEIKEKWNSNVDGIGNKQGVFYFSENGGKKVPTYTGVLVNQEYLLLTNQNIGISSFKGMNFDFIQEINFGWLNKYNVYKFVINEKCEDTDKFCKQFDMELKYSKPDLIPIWPPCSAVEDEWTYENSDRKYFILKSDNESKELIYSQREEKFLLYEKICKNRYLLTAKGEYDDLISISNLESKALYSIKNKREGREGDLYSNINIKSNKNNEIIFSSDRKIILHHFKNNMLFNSTTIKDNSEKIMQLKKKEKLFFLYGTDSIHTLFYKEDERVLSNIKVSDDKLLKQIKREKGNKVKITDEFKWLIQKYKGSEKIYIELIKLMKKGEVSVELINILKMCK